MKRMFAIGLSRGWIELREAEKPPRATTTEVMKPVRERVKNRYDIVTGPDGMNRVVWHYKTLKRVMKLVTTTHTGGKPIGTIRSRQFSNLLKVSVRTGGMLELTPEMFELLGEKGPLNVWNRKNVFNKTRETY
jgi:hypothetical protein